MKVLKKYGLTFVLLAALIVTFALGVVFMMPAKTVSADEEFVPQNTVTVTSEQTLKKAVADAADTPTKIILGENIEMNSITSGGEGTKYYELIVERGQSIQLDLAGFELSVPVRKNTEGCVIENHGTLSIIDSENYQGAVVSNGYISLNAGKMTWLSADVIQNHGELTVDANLRIQCPESTAEGTDGYYETTGNFNYAFFVESSLYIPTLSDVDRTYQKASTVINGGNFDLNCGPQVIPHFFSIAEADLTVNGGSFKNTSSTRPGQDGFLATLRSIDFRESPYTNHNVYGDLNNAAIKNFRHVHITVTGGDFKDKNLIQGENKGALLYIFDFYGSNKSTALRIDGEEYTVAVTGGTFPLDLSGYLDVDHAMLEEKVTQDGVETGEVSYTVVGADKQGAVAILKQGDEIKGYYSSFTSAWNAAMTQTTDRTIVLQKDATVIDQTLLIKGRDVNTTLDLNGHTLTVTPPVTPNGWDYHFKNDETHPPFYGIFTVKDSNRDGGGELILNYPDKSTKGGFHINGGYQFVLESGTIRVTGVKPSTRNQYNALFQFDVSSKKQKADSVIIKGGNIVSDWGTEGIYFGAWAYGSSSWSYSLDKNNEDWKPDTGYETPSKYESLRFDIDDYLAAHNTMKFSWDLTAFLPDGMTCTPGESGYVITNVQTGDNYFANETKFAELSDAIQAAQSAPSNKTVTLLRDMTETGDVEIPEGITLDLNPYLHFTFGAENVILNENTALKNGTVNANVTVKGKTEFLKLTVKKDLTVAEGGDLTIKDGTYDGALNVNGGTLLLMGGKFADGGTDDAKLKGYDQYIQPGFGASGVENGYRTVRGGLASLAALQQWYATGVKPAAAEAGTAFTIKDTTEWLYFTSIVNSGTDNFANCTVTLVYDLDFRDSIFIPAGTAGHDFAGTLIGNNKTISNAHAKEHYAGVFGVGANTFTVTDLNVVSSSFVSGPGYLDDVSVDWGWGAAGAIVGAGFIGKDSSGLKISGTEINTEYGYVYLGGIIGHTFGGVTLKDITLENVSVEQKWKSGGIVGQVDYGLYLENLTVTGLEFTGTMGGWCPSGVLAGDLNSATSTVTNAKIDCPEIPLTGSSSHSVAITVDGAETDIHVGSLGDAGSFEIVLEQDEASSAQVQVGSSLPSNVTIKDKEGNTVEQEPNPDGNGFIMQADSKAVEVFYGEGEILDSFDTLQDAINAAGENNRIYLKKPLTESVTVGAEKKITINLYKNTLTGTIAVEGALILENGKVVGSVANGGTLTLATGEIGLIIENTEAVVTGNDYTVDGTPCIRETVDGEVVTRLELALTHDYTKYTAVGNVITVSCVHDGVVEGTVTLKAPEAPKFGDEAIGATVEIDPEGFIEAPEITYTDAEGHEVKTITEAGKYTASIKLGDVTASVTFVVKQQELTITDIEGTISYQGDTALTIDVESYVLKDLNGIVVELKDITVTVTLEKSKYSVGNDQYALITEIHMSGNDNYALSTVGNQLYMKLDVTQTTLTVRVNNDGSVSYVGFVGGEDESVLGGSLKLDYTDNGDGTSTVTPSGLESINYHIVYEAGIVSNNVAGNENNTLWIVLAVLGAVAVVAVATVIVCEVRRKRN